MPNPSPTIRTLASSLGLSRTTVSDALRRSPRVKPETMRRVQLAAAAANYRLNPLAGAVMSEMRRSRGQTFRGALAAIDLDESDRPVPAVRYHEALIHGASRRATELGYKLQTFVVGRKGVSLPRLDTILQSRGIQGVLVLPAWRDPDLTPLDWTRYTGIYTDYIIEHPGLHSVCCDHYRSMFDVMGRLGRLGFRRPGLFVLRKQDERLQNRWEGAFLAYQCAHLDAGDVPPLAMDEMAGAPFQRWFKRHRPDVVLGHFTGAIEWMADAGFRVPDQAGFFCLNLTMEPGSCAGLDLQPSLIGTRSAEMLTAQLQRNERGIPEHPSTTLIPGLWVDGPTLAARVPLSKLRRR